MFIAYVCSFQFSFASVLEDSLYSYKSVALQYVGLMFHTCIDRSSTAPNMPWETLVSEQPEVDQSPHGNAGKEKQNHSFSAMATRFFDEKVPLKKKVWCITL